MYREFTEKEGKDLVYSITKHFNEKNVFIWVFLIYTKI